ncbi:MAG: phage portal protein family protein [Puniceicoccales bacterium]
MKTHSQLPPSRVRRNRRAAFNPVRSLTPESLTRQLDSFHAGHLAEAARLWDVIEQRDDVVKAVSCKRKKSPGRFGWDIVADDESAEALRHKAALEDFYANIDVRHASDLNERGGMALLLRQMMDAVGKRYAVHEIVWRPQSSGDAQRLHASFRFAPLWFFENKTGELRFLPDESSREGQRLRDGEWLITTGDGLMEATSIAYLFKHLPLRDWLIYCERNGMPGVRGVTDATPGTPEWDSARDAVRDFGAEFHALMSRGTDIEPIDLSANGQLPYPQLVDRMDKAIATLWRGSSMGSIADGGAGITLQGKETALIEREDIAHLSETLHTQVDRWITRHLFGEAPRARIVIRHKESGIAAEELEGAREVLAETLPKAIANLFKRLAFPDRFQTLQDKA